MAEKYEKMFGQNSNLIYDTVKDCLLCPKSTLLRNREEPVEDGRGRVKSLVPIVMVVRYTLKMSYKKAPNLLKTMYREWDIDYNMRGHHKRIHRKASKKAPKRECLLATSHLVGCFQLRIIVDSMNLVAKITPAIPAESKMQEMPPL